MGNVEIRAYGTDAMSSLLELKRAVSYETAISRDSIKLIEDGELMLQINDESYPIKVCNDEKLGVIRTSVIISKLDIEKED